MPIIDDIKDRLDILDVVGSYLKLTKSGANYKGLCPFHKEKTPSFMVSPERQIWHCFGCGEGGDIFKFVMKYENLEFPEALRLLAKQAGIELKKEDPRLRSEISKLYDICEKALEYFEIELSNSESTKNYLLKRGLKNETTKYWQLGFAPNLRDSLMRFLLKSGFKIEDVLKTGLVIKSVTHPNSYFDRFRDRVIFPIFDNQDRVAGFTGRILNEANHPNEPKYLNSPESLIFNKGRILYGFSKNKKDIKEKNSVLLVEGQMDFLMAWQSGIRNIVATSGTALTQDQLKNIKRMTKNITIGYDMDEAGRIATERAIDLAKEAELNVKVLTLPEGYKDIADYCLDKSDSTAELINGLEDAGDYYYRIAVGNSDKNDLEQKKKAVSFLLSKIRYIANAIERSHWINKISNDFQIKESYLEEELLKIAPNSRSGFFKEDEATINTQDIKTRKEALGERVLAIAVKESSLRPRILEIKGYFGGDDESAIIDFLASQETIDFDNNPLADRIAYLKLLADYEFQEELDIIEEFEVALKELKKESLRELISQKSFLIKEAEKNDDLELLNKNLNEFKDLLRQLSSL